MYLKDSEVSAIEFKAEEDLLRLVKAEVQRNVLAAMESNSQSFRVRVPSLYRGPILNLIVKEYESSQAQATEGLTIGTDRKESIGEYLRDAANSESTIVNLGLQRLVIILAIMTVVAGLLALIPGMLTDDQKKALWNGHFAFGDVSHKPQTSAPPPHSPMRLPPD